ncbi:MAG: hypothetical protein U0793_29555 [Gemmataceae bacterium]
MSVGVDTMVLIWGLKRVIPRQTSQNVAEMCRRAQILFKNLRNQRIIVPTIAISELLCGVDPKDHGNFVAELKKQFFCPPFDLSACALSATLFRYGKTLSDKLARPLLKLDTMIIAAVKTAGGTTFYSHEPACRKIAEQAGLEAHDLPSHYEDFLDDPDVAADSPSQTDGGQD